jgi:hypothetical protein
MPTWEPGRNGTRVMRGGIDRAMMVELHGICATVPEMRRSPLRSTA